MSEVAFGEEGEVEEDGCDDAAGDEEGFQAECANVGDVGDVLTFLHGGILGLVQDEPADEHS